MFVPMLLLSFLLGVGVTYLWAVRTVHREVPTSVLHEVWGERDGAAAVETVHAARHDGAVAD